jgi:hypothetical protein
MADNADSVDTVSPIVFQCERCGLPASLGSGLVSSVIASHLVDTTLDGCRQLGGPFSDGLNARQLEDRYREALGLPFLRPRP